MIRPAEVVALVVGITRFHDFVEIAEEFPGFLVTDHAD